MSATLNAYKGMTIRNIKIYMKDKTAILLSMLAQIIVLGLFVLFLRDNYVGSIKDGLGELQNLLSDSDIDKIVNGWMISGVIGTALVTVALNSLVVIVKDKEDKINYDYTASPVKPHTVVLSYFTASVINTFVVSAILMTAGFVFLGISCDTTYSPIEILKMYGLVALGSISSALILMVIATFFKKSSSLGSFGALVSAAIGFIIGAYVPVSQFSDTVQTIVNLVPGSQIAGMMRSLLMKSAVENAQSAIGSKAGAEFANQMNKLFAIKLNIFGSEVDFTFMMIYSIVAIVLFLAVNLIVYKFTSKTKE